MYWLRYALAFLMLFCLTHYLPTQAQKPKQTTSIQTKDVDPLALDVLRAVAQPVEQAQGFSFRALISEEELATDGQIVTFFHSVDVTVQRPDKYISFSRPGTARELLRRERNRHHVCSRCRTLHDHPG